MQNASTSGGPNNAALAWDIQITLRVLLAENDVAGLDVPPPLYIQVHRQGYLHTILPKIKPLWQHVLPPEVQGPHIPWFSYNSLPLKWNVPLGPLYDLLAFHHGTRPAPWQLTLHFTGFPSSTLPDYTGESSIQKSLFNSLKEASFIAQKTAHPVMHMVEEAQNDLWKTLGGSGGGGGGISGNGSGNTSNGTITINYNKYEDIMHSLRLISPNELEKVPIRVYIRPPSTGGWSGYLSSYELISYTSRPAPVMNATDGQLMTLGAALAPIIIACLIENRGWSPKKEILEKESGKNRLVQEEDAGTITAEEDEEQEKIQAAWAQVDVALSGGIELQPDLVLQDLHRDLHSPDFFLYIVLHMRPTQR